MPAPRIVPADAAALDEAGALIRAGELVAFPTETVYGLGADATNDRAVAAIFEAKGRPRFNPLIVHFSDREAAAREAAFTPLAGRLADAFWPGPLTLVLPRAEGCRLSLLVSAGLDTVAVRVPGLVTARAFLTACGRPVAAPSANRSGQVSPTTAEHVAHSLGDRVALILDAGPCHVGLESTVVDCTGDAPVLLRPGGITREQIEEVAGAATVAGAAPDAPRSPGMLASHYAPSIPVRLNATEALPDEALLAFGHEIPEGAATTLNLSADGNLVEAAANLFAMLRVLDRPEHTAIAVMPVPVDGLGAAINDRLQRAAAAR